MASFHTSHIYANWEHRRGPRPDGGVEETPNGTTTSGLSLLKIAQALCKRMETRVCPVITLMGHVDNALYGLRLLRLFSYKPSNIWTFRQYFSFLLHICRPLFYGTDDHVASAILHVFLFF